MKLYQYNDNNMNFHLTSLGKYINAIQFLKALATKKAREISKYGVDFVPP